MNFSLLFAKSKYVLEKVSCKKGYIYVNKYPE